MPESRGESFYGGRFFERKFGADPFEPSDAKYSSRTWDYEVGFRASNQDDAPAAYVSTVYRPDEYDLHDPRVWEGGHNYRHPDGQFSLFAASPEQHEIDEAYSTKDARHHIPTLLGMAAQHSLTNRGHLPRASADLSPQSTRLVQKAVGMGLIKNPGSGTRVEPKNEINWDSGSHSAQWRSRDVQYDGAEVPFDRVNKSRQFVRDVLRRPRRYQAEQLTID